MIKDCVLSNQNRQARRHRTCHPSLSLTLAYTETEMGTSEDLVSLKHFPKGPPLPKHHPYHACQPRTTLDESFH